MRKISRPAATAEPATRPASAEAAHAQRVAGFGRNGIVDLKQDFDQAAVDLTNGAVGLHAAPVIAKDVVIIGAAFETGANPKSKTNIKGYVRGFDVRTGKRAQAGPFDETRPSHRRLTTAVGFRRATPSSTTRA